MIIIGIGNFGRCSFNSSVNFVSLLSFFIFIFVVLFVFCFVFRLCIRFAILFTLLYIFICRFRCVVVSLLSKFHYTQHTITLLMVLFICMRVYCIRIFSCVFLNEFQLVFMYYIREMLSTQEQQQQQQYQWKILLHSYTLVFGYFKLKYFHS